MPNIQGHPCAAAPEPPSAMASERMVSIPSLISWKPRPAALHTVNLGSRDREGRIQSDSMTDTSLSRHSSRPGTAERGQRTFTSANTHWKKTNASPPSALGRAKHRAKNLKSIFVAGGLSTGLSKGSSSGAIQMDVVSARKGAKLRKKAITADDRTLTMFRRRNRWTTIGAAAESPEIHFLCALVYQTFHAAESPEIHFLCALVYQTFQLSPDSRHENQVKAEHLYQISQVQDIFSS